MFIYNNNNKNNKFRIKLKLTEELFYNTTKANTRLVHVPHFLMLTSKSIHLRINGINH